MSKSEILALVKAKMRANKLTCYRLAKESGVPYATLNDWLLGKTDIGLAKAEKVLEYLGIEPSK